MENCWSRGGIFQPGQINLINLLARAIFFLQSLGWESVSQYYTLPKNKPCLQSSDTNKKLSSIRFWEEGLMLYNITTSTTANTKNKNEQTKQTNNSMQAKSPKATMSSHHKSLLPTSRTARCSTSFTWWPLPPSAQGCCLEPPPCECRCDSKVTL